MEGSDMSHYKTTLETQWPRRRWGGDESFGDFSLTSVADERRELVRLKQVEKGLDAALKQMNSRSRAVHSRDTCLADLAEEIQAVLAQQPAGRTPPTTEAPRPPPPPTTEAPRPPPPPGAGGLGVPALEVELRQKQEELADKARETEAAARALLPPEGELAAAAKQLSKIDSTPFNTRVKRGGGSKKRKTKKRKSKKRKSKTRRRRR